MFIFHPVPSTHIPTGYAVHTATLAAAQAGALGFLYEAQMPPSELYPALFYFLLK